MAVDRDRLTRAVRELLEAIGDDPARPGLDGTPERVAESWAEMLGGVGRDPLDELRSMIPVGDDAGELVLMTDIEFRSFCEHHLLPFVGRAHIAYLPRERVVGLGALPRVVAALAERPQVQERLTEQIAAAIEEGLAPGGVLVVLEASHGCVTVRGPRQLRSRTVTVASRGELADPMRRAEAMALITRATDEA